MVRWRLSGEIDLDFVFLAMTLVSKSLFILEQGLYLVANSCEVGVPVYGDVFLVQFWALLCEQVAICFGVNYY